jgi:hypothetical protein
MILPDKKIIFIHIPRTGGTSVEKYFNFKYEAGWKPKTAQHLTLQEYSEHYDTDNYFKFTIVRNPWDRLMSWYLWSYAEVIYFQYLSENGQFSTRGSSSRLRAWHKGRQLLSDKSNKFTDQKLFLKFKTAFSSFVERLESQKDLINDPVFDNNISIENRLNGRWIMPQVRWLEVEGKVDLNYICKFEKLKANFNTVLRKNKLKPVQLERLGKIHNKPNYRKFYTKKNQQIVSKIYSEDIKKFKYEF